MEKASAKVIRSDTRAFVPRFSHGEMAGIAEVTGAADGTRLGTGFVRFRAAEIPWKVRYDEVILVLEGNVVIRTPECDLEAGPQDCVWLPSGTTVTYIADDAFVFYAIEPSTWAETRT